MGAFSTRHGFQVDRDDVLLLFRWNQCQVMCLPILQFLFEIIQNSCVIVHISAEANSVEWDRCLIKIHIWALELSWYFSTVVIINMAELNIVNNKKQILINYDNYFLMNFIQKTVRVYSSKSCSKSCRAYKIKKIPITNSFAK